MFSMIKFLFYILNYSQNYSILKKITLTKQKRGKQKTESRKKPIIKYYKSVFRKINIPAIISSYNNSNYVQA